MAVLSPGTVCTDVHPHSLQPTQNTVSSDTVLFSFSLASSQCAHPVHCGMQPCIRAAVYSAAKQQLQMHSNTIRWV